jgi:hypothetical protein
VKEFKNNVGKEAAAELDEADPLPEGSYVLSPSPF